MFFICGQIEIEVFQVDYSNNDGNEPDMNILLTSNSVNERVSNWIPIKSHQKDTLLIFRGMACIDDSIVLLSIYSGYSIHGGLFLKCQWFFLEVSSWEPVCCGSNKEN